MRFTEDGPLIPDELLLARDEGRVVFFCGAGVSQNSAKLPDFVTLTRAIIEGLGAENDSPAYKVFNESERISKEVKEGSLISGDRIFGLLERDFFTKHIEEKVAQELEPIREGNYLDSHKTIVQLATTSTGKVQLVTTNFDRLFEECAPELETFLPPKLVDCSSGDELDGIVYLHGRVNESYEKADPKGGGFVLASSQYGRAYLSEGWATTFFKEILARFTVVFIGYSADDPPIQYLLEALKRAGYRSHGIYAFEEGDKRSAEARWGHKGVTAIPFASYTSLWSSLGKWSERAKDPESWTNSIIELAAESSPESLDPFQRGQVAHVVSTLDGARKFHSLSAIPSGEWLFVFDSRLRINGPTHLGRSSLNNEIPPAFEMYGLDNDASPQANSDAPKIGRTQASSWDAFMMSTSDFKNGWEDGLSPFKGVYAQRASSLSPRHKELGIWLAKVSKQIITIRWATHQTSLHPDLQEMITRQFNRNPNSFDKSDALCEKVWLRLFEYYDQKPADQMKRLEPYSIEREAKRLGWNAWMVGRLCDSVRPYLTIRSVNSFRLNQFDDWREAKELRDIFSLDVSYPRIHDIDFPSEVLAALVKGLRNNLEYAQELEAEANGLQSWAFRMDSIEPDTRPGTRWGRSGDDLSSLVMLYVKCLKKLMSLDLDKAQHEVRSWLPADNSIFCRLKVWACGVPDLTSIEDVEQFFSEMSDDVFWDDYHRRDLLHTLSRRWSDLSIKSSLEQRFISGEPKYNAEGDEAHQRHGKLQSLNCLTWLEEQKCTLSDQCKERLELSKQEVPGWEPGTSSSAADSMGTMGGLVQTNDDCSELLPLALSSILNKAVEISKEERRFLSERDPFLGLSKNHTYIAVIVLSQAADKGEYPVWAWEKLLSQQVRDATKEPCINIIAKLIVVFSDEVLKKLSYVICGWFAAVTPGLEQSDFRLYLRLLWRLIDFHRSNPTCFFESLISADRVTGWAESALNSSVGKLARSLVESERIKKKGVSLPGDWSKVATTLLQLDGDMRRHALVMFFHHLSFFYHKDTQWTEDNLLPALESDCVEDKYACWCGIFWNPQIRGYDLFKLIKPTLFELAKDSSFTEHYSDLTLANLLLTAWNADLEAGGQPLVSDEELRSLLLNIDESLVINLLNRLESWGQGRIDQEEEDGDGGDDDRNAVVNFFEKVWPLQKRMCTSRISEKLFELILSSAEMFPVLAPILRKFIHPLEVANNMSLGFQGAEGQIVSSHPALVLDIVFDVLPKNSGFWPYGMNDFLQKIIDADSSLESDSKMIELKRRWSSS